VVACAAVKCGAHMHDQSPAVSMLCHGVSVPPQSKITACTVTARS
jgi:hypothetical protein